MKNSCHKTSARGVCPNRATRFQGFDRSDHIFKEMLLMRGTILASLVLTGVTLCAAGVYAHVDDARYSLTCNDQVSTDPSKEEAKRAEVLVLGVYHMANPGHDIFNMQADDVLAPKRQQEIVELAGVLKKFKP